MKRWGIKFLLLAIASILVVVAVKYWPRVLTPDQCSEVYRRYKDRDGLHVAFVKDYSIGDSIIVDVTTIEATDSANWDKLLRDLNVHEYTISLNRQYVQDGKSPVSTSYRLKDNPSQKSTDNDNPNNTLMVTAYREQIVYFFSIDSKNQTHNIMDVKLSEIVHNKNQQK